MKGMWMERNFRGLVVVLAWYLLGWPAEKPRKFSFKIEHVPTGIRTRYLANKIPLHQPVRVFVVTNYTGVLISC